MPSLPNPLPLRRPGPRDTRCVGRSSLRLAAIDLDGTLLSPDLSISAENRRAVARLQSAGIEVVLASGRHHASARPYAVELPGVRWIVSAQGGEVSDVNRSRILAQTFLRRTQLEVIRATQAELGITGVFYTPDGILMTGEPDAAVEFYRSLAGMIPRRVTDEELLAAEVFKVVWIGNSEFLDRLSEESRVKALDLQKVRTHAQLLEVMPVEMTKAAGLTVLAAHLGVRAGEVVAFGDAENDLAMFAWAGLSVAMDHGWPLAKAQAERIAPPGPPGTALARAIDAIDL